MSRDLDTRIASEVLNQVVLVDNKSGKIFTIGKNMKKEEVPEYSTDDEYTNALVEFMVENGFELRSRKATSQNKDVWYASFVPSYPCVPVSSTGPSRGISICHAAIAVVEGTHISKRKV